jgi:hypothetical protein
MSTLAFMLAALATAAVASLAFVLFKNKALQNQINSLETDLTNVRNEAEQRFRAGEELVRQELERQKTEVQRISSHYQAEASRVQSEAEETIRILREKLDAFQDLSGLGRSVDEIQSELAKAIAEATDLRDQALQFFQRAKTTADSEISAASQRAKELRSRADALLSQAMHEAGDIVEHAKKQAEQLGGDAYAALNDKQRLEQACVAIRNVIDGYGDRYIIPTRSLLDELAEDFGHMEAGQMLGSAREQSRRMVIAGEAAACDYVESSRKDTAIRFVIDAFNGRVDAILSQSRHDNFGTLHQQIVDAFALVNLNGKAFKDARILDAYRDARLFELKWAVAAKELRFREQEEQRRLKEQIREEEKARREYEKAMKDAQREEEILTKALEKAREEAAKATAEQKEKLEQQIAELNQKLSDAEARNQRALSMAQQTRKGNVYIISNIGSFGEDVLKIGMTRRLEPLDRVKELGDASVPFEFDVHAMIPSDDAPALENLMHNQLEEHRLNHVNYRKEFFKVSLDDLRKFLADKGIQASFTMLAEARQYRESVRLRQMTPEQRQQFWRRQETNRLKPNLRDSNLAGDSATVDAETGI